VKITFTYRKVNKQTAMSMNS